MFNLKNVFTKFNNSETPPFVIASGETPQNAVASGGAEREREREDLP